MTVGELLSCYTETMNKDSVRIYIQSRPENVSRSLFYQKPICDLEDKYRSLVVTSWFATPYSNNETEITVFVTEESALSVVAETRIELADLLNPETIDLTEQEKVDLFLNARRFL